MEGGGNKTKQNKSNTAQLARFPRSSLACLFTHFMFSLPPFFFFLPLLLSLHCFMNLCHARLTPLTPLEFSFAFMHKCTCNVKESAAKEKRHLQRHIKGKVKTQKAVSFAFLLLPFFILKKRTLCVFFFFCQMAPRLEKANLLPGAMRGSSRHPRFSFSFSFGSWHLFLSLTHVKEQQQLETFFLSCFGLLLVSFFFLYSLFNTLFFRSTRYSST